MEKKPDLPWGRAVQIELLFHAFDRPAARGPTANVVDVTSNAFVYKLRDAPY